MTLAAPSPTQPTRVDALSPLHMPPTGGETGTRNSTLLVLLGLALKLFDSSSGFRLPDGSVLSPDAALVRLRPEHHPCTDRLCRTGIICSTSSLG